MKMFPHLYTVHLANTVNLSYKNHFVTKHNRQTYIYIDCYILNHLLNFYNQRKICLLIMDL